MEKRLIQIASLLLCIILIGVNIRIPQSTAMQESEIQVTPQKKLGRMFMLLGILVFSFLLKKLYDLWNSLPYPDGYH